MLEHGAEVTRLSTKVQNSASEEDKVLADGVAKFLDGLQRTALILVLVALAAGAGLAWGIGRGIARPIVGITALMRRLADGDHELTITGAERGDEIGTMAKAVEVFARA